MAAQSTNESVFPPALVAGNHTFSSITEAVCSVVEEKPNVNWLLSLMLAASIMAILGGSVARICSGKEQVFGDSTTRSVGAGRSSTSYSGLVLVTQEPSFQLFCFYFGRNGGQDQPVRRGHDHLCCYLCLGFPGYPCWSRLGSLLDVAATEPDGDVAKLFEVHFSGMYLRFRPTSPCHSFFGTSA